MKKIVNAWDWGMVAVIAVMFMAVFVYADDAAPFEVDIFFRDEGGACTGCGYDEFAVESDIRLSVRRAFSQMIDNGQIIFNIYNLYRDENYYLKLEARLENLDVENLRTPAFFTQDGYYFGGIQAISQLQDHFEDLGFGAVAVRQVPYMPEGTVIAPRDDRPYENISVGDSVVVYFYTPWCPFCYEIAPIMNNLPEYVMIDGQKSYVRLVSYNRDIDDDHEIIRRYHDMFNIPVDRRFVPLVLVGYRDLFLYDELRAGLIPALEAGEGLLTPLFTERQPLSEPISAWPFILTGLGGVIITASIFFWIIFRKKKDLQ